MVKNLKCTLTEQRYTMKIQLALLTIRIKYIHGNIRNNWGCYSIFLEVPIPLCPEQIKLA
jgi:hypothetical protein